MSKILSLDQALNVSGWAFFDEDLLKDYGKHTTKDTEDTGARLMDLRIWLLDMIEKYHPDIVVFEDILQQTNVLTFKKLAEVYGVIDETLTELDITHESVVASSWKSTLNIKGKARTELKQNALKWVVDTYGIKPTQDTCDAICIGAHYIKASAGAW